MKITYSNKTLKTKPNKDWEYGKYFGKQGTPNRIRFKTEELEIDDFENIISNGHTLSYQFVGDDAMNRKANYIGTDYIIIDIDETDFTIDEVIERATYTPTIIHTTFSNLTERKNNKFCYHLVYCMDNTLFGENNFDRAFSYFSLGIEDLIDYNAKDCHRITFTSNRSLPNYEYRLQGDTYSITNIIGEGNNFITDVSSGYKKDTSVKKSNFSSIYNSLYNMNEGEKNLTDRYNNFNLNQEFIADLTKKNRVEFIAQYNNIYEYITYTPPTITNTTTEGIVYADYRGVDYYELPSLWRTNEIGVKERKRIEIGNRTKQLYVETNLFLLITPNISKENLIYDVVRDVYENYNNADGQFNNHYILSLVENVWKNRNEFVAYPIPKKFKILRYVDGMSKHTCVGIVRKLMKDESIGSVIDINLSVEENLGELKRLGIKIKKKRLLQFIQDNHLEGYIKTDKQRREEQVMTIIKEHPDVSLRKLEELCKQEGLSVSYETIRKIREKTT